MLAYKEKKLQMDISGWGRGKILKYLQIFVLFVPKREFLWNSFISANETFNGEQLSLENQLDSGSVSPCCMNLVLHSLFV